MTFLAPFFLLAAAVVAVGVIALHLLALRRPPPVALPTARFVPDVPARAASRALRPRDPLLLALRLLAVALLGLAFARPVRAPDRIPVRQVIVVDQSRAVESIEEVRDSLRAHLRPGDAIIVLDSTARALAWSDSAPALQRVEARARLASGIVAARRAAAALRDSTDSVRMVVVSAVAEEQLDAATAAVRAGWTGQLHLVRVAARRDSPTPAPIDVQASNDDLLGVAIARDAIRAATPLRLLRESPTAADSVWARGSGAVLLVWPDRTPPGWGRRSVTDTVGAVLTAHATVVAPFAREAIAPPGERAHAWWVDGEAAVTEAPLGAGCIRTAGIPLAGTGDLVLRPAFARFVRALSVPCGGERALAPASDSVLALLAGDPAMPTAVALPVPQLERAPLVPWLLAMALAVLLLEMLVRARTPRVASASGEVVA